MYAKCNTASLNNTFIAITSIFDIEEIDTAFKDAIETCKLELDICKPEDTRPRHSCLSKISKALLKKRNKLQKTFQKTRTEEAHQEATRATRELRQSIKRDNILQHVNFQQQLIDSIINKGETQM